jgi:hypothetical protein
MLVQMGHHGVSEVAGVNPLAADDDRNLDPLVGHRDQAALEFGALG